MIVDSDLLRDVLLNACPDVLTDEACQQTVDRALAELARIDGVTVVHGPEGRRWGPDQLQASSKLDHNLEQPGGVGRLTRREHDRMRRVDQAIKDRDAEIAQLRAQLDRIGTTNKRLAGELDDTDGFIRECYRIVGKTGGQQDDEVLDALRGLAERAETAQRQRDEWIARHVTAHDALTRVRSKVTELVAECLLSDEHEVTEYAVMVGADNLEEAPTCVEGYDDQAEAEELAQYVPGAWIASRRVHVGSWVPVVDDDLVRPGESSHAADEPGCVYCGRSRATHQIIRTHRYMHPQSPYWLGIRARAEARRG